MHGPLEGFFRKLLSANVPHDHAERLAGELGEHREDLVAEALASGLSPSEAARVADERLGAGDALVRAVLGALRQRTLLGRRPVLGMFVLPLACFPLLWTAVLVVVGGLVLALEWAGVPERERLTFVVLGAACHVVGHCVGVAVALWAYHSGCASALGPVRSWAACALVALAASFNHVRLTPPSAREPTGSLAVGLSPVPSWQKVLLPLSVVASVDAAQRLRRRRRLLVS